MAGLAPWSRSSASNRSSPPGRGELAPRSDGEHRAVVGLLDDRTASGRIVTVLDSDLLLERLQALRYLTDADD